MPKRMQSPSSINTYKQCPRKYFYQYIMKLPTKPSIHQIRGGIVHEVLEKFFSIDLGMIDPNDFEYGFRNYLSATMSKLWRESAKELSTLGLTNQQLEFYFVESIQMLNNFLDKFSKKLKKKIKEKKGDFQLAFKSLIPSVEEEIIDPALNVKGFIDAVHDDEEGVIIMDYKTSNKEEITVEYKLQLGIYALLYKSKYSKTPAKVGVNFLKYGEQTIDVDDVLLEHAKKEILFVHEMTSSDKVADYPRKEGPLCKWSSGKCDYYEKCFEQKNA